MQRRRSCTCPYGYAAFASLPWALVATNCDVTHCVRKTDVSCLDLCCVLGIASVALEAHAYCEAVSRDAGAHEQLRSHQTVLPR